jgi:hypothetical protein
MVIRRLFYFERAARDAGGPENASSQRPLPGCWLLESVRAGMALRSKSI